MASSTCLAIQSRNFAGPSTRSSIRNMGHSSSNWLKVELDKAVRRPRAVVVEGVVVIEALGSLEHMSLELRLAVTVNQTGKVHYLAFVARLVVFDFGAATRQHLFDAAGES